MIFVFREVSFLLCSRVPTSCLLVQYCKSVKQQATAVIISVCKQEISVENGLVLHLTDNRLCKLVLVCLAVPIKLLISSILKLLELGSSTENSSTFLLALYCALLETQGTSIHFEVLHAFIYVLL